MKNNLFDSFQDISSKQWKNQIQYELKGADYNEHLVWESPEGIKVKPFYHHDEDAINPVVAMPTNPFAVVQNIFVHDVALSVKKAIDALQRGAESIRFTIENEQIDIDLLLKNIDAQKHTIYIKPLFFSPAFIQKVNKIAENQSAFIYVLLDPIHQLASDGNWFKTPDNDNFVTLQSLVKTCKNCSLITINAQLYQNAGANMVQQLAYTAAHLLEYLNRIENYNHPIVVEIAVGTNYFFEIAKLRALRLLLESVLQELQLSNEIHLIATPTQRNKTLYDYNVNMLRTTTECMSAILGGANAVANLPYDAIYHKDNEFGERIARNQLLVLKHESYLDQVSNAADGAYYIENLTQQLAEKALNLLKDIESNEGFLAQLKEGTIQRKIQESAQKEQDLLDAGKEILVGTNKYPNKNDRMKNELELYPFVKQNPRKTLITPIIEKRLAEKIEQERLNNE